MKKAPAAAAMRQMKMKQMKNAPGASAMKAITAMQARKAMKALQTKRANWTRINVANTVTVFVPDKLAKDVWTKLNGSWHKWIRGRWQPLQQKWQKTKSQLICNVR